MSIDLTASIVRILTSEGKTAGTGFVVSDDGLIATCAHAMKGVGVGPGDSVHIVFRVTGEKREARVEPDWWRNPDAEDVAILRLEGSLPEGVEPLMLGSSGGTSGHPFKAFGFPAAKDTEGMWGYGNLGDPTTEADQTVLQLTGTTEITLGFSGAPVLNTVTRRVVGMVTSITVPDQYGRLTETAFITPTETLRAVCPLLCLSDICPYRGLAAFTEADAEFFFGREEVVADLVACLRGSPRFLVVVGPSGSGKSSVVQAGLFPALRQGEVPGSGAWDVLSFRPGADPFAALAAAGLDLTSGASLQTAIRASLEGRPEVERVVLFADQFEELFALCPEPVRERFLGHLLTLLESGLPVTMVLALRADFYGHLLRCGSLLEWLKMGQVNVPPMREDELWDAVEEPAERVGLRFEPGLVEAIVEEASRVEYPLPLLEAALTQLWAQMEGGVLTHTAYQMVGRVAGAISQWAEDTYSGLGGKEGPLAQRVFTRLLHYSEGEAADTRQRRPLAELMARPEEQESIHRLVQRLADARLLVTDRDPRTGEETAEIIHDALLWEWGRLRRWVTEQREFYLWRQRLDERLQEWEEKERDEGALLRGALLAEAERWLAERPDDLNPDEREYIQESVALRERERVARERLRRRIILGLAVGLVVTVVLALIAWGQRNAALGAQATAVVEANDRATAQAQAQAAEGTAVAEADFRATAQAEAIAQRDEAEEQRQIALARQLAAQAELIQNQQTNLLPRSVLLAAESLLRSPSVEGGLALRHGLTLLPRPIVTIAHEEGVNAVAWSLDGKWLATGSDDGIAQVWEAATGQEVARMAHEDRVGVVTFSPDGEWLATGSDDLTARVWEAATGREVARVEHESVVLAVTFSPDGRWLATGSFEGVVRVWEAATGQEVARMAHEGRVLAVVFSPDGEWLATGSDDGTARVWESATGQEVVRLEHGDGVSGVAFSPDGEWLAAASWDDTARVWEVATGQEVVRIEHEGAVWAVAFSPDGRLLATAGLDNTARVWEVVTGREVARMQHEDGVEAAILSPDGEWLATRSWDGTARVWEATTGQEVARMAHEDAVEAVAFSPNGEWLATGSKDHTARVWEVVAATGQEVAHIEHEWLVYAVAFNPTGEWVVTGSWDGTARVWEAATGQEVAHFDHRGEVMGVAFSPDGRWLAIGSGEGSFEGSSSGEVQVWKTTSQEIAWTVQEGMVRAVAFSPDGEWLAAAIGNPYGSSGGARVWEVATGQEIAHMTHKEAAEVVAFSPDGRLLATGSWDDTARVWEVVTGQEVARIEHGGVVRAVAFSPDGEWLATGSEDQTARVCEAATGREVARMEHEDAVWAVAFSPDGRLLATAGWDNTVRVWKVATGREVARMQHEDVLRAVAFSPDGRWLATGSEDRTARVWEVATGREVARMKHEGLVWAVAFSPDGKWLATGGGHLFGAGEARVWLVWPEDLIAEACSRLTRNLTVEEWKQYIGDEPYRPTCSNLPVPNERQPRLDQQPDAEDSQGERWRTYRAGEAFRGSSVLAGGIDNDGHKWFGTDVGVSEFTGYWWRDYTPEPRGAYYSSIAVDAAGHVWTAACGKYVGYGSGPLVEFDGYRWRAHTAEEGLAHRCVTDIAVDREGHMWFATLDGVTEFDDTTWRTYTKDDGLVSNIVYDIFIDEANNHKWFGTYDGLSEFDGNAWNSYSTGDEMRDYISAVAIDTAGHIWIGSHHDGVSEFDGTTWHTYTTDDGLVSNEIRSIAVDAEDHKWVGTAGGVSEFDGHIWRTYITADGLQLAWVYCMFADDLGHLWFCTTTGIAELIRTDGAAGDVENSSRPSNLP